jgi:hypothetical protein
LEVVDRTVDLPSGHRFEFLALSGCKEPAGVYGHVTVCARPPAGGLLVVRPVRLAFRDRLFGVGSYRRAEQNRGKGVHHGGGDLLDADSVSRCVADRAGGFVFAASDGQRNSRPSRYRGLRHVVPPSVADGGPDGDASSK